MEEEGSHQANIYTHNHQAPWQAFSIGPSQLSAARWHPFHAILSSKDTAFQGSCSAALGRTVGAARQTSPSPSALLQAAAPPCLRPLIKPHVSINLTGTQKQLNKRKMAGSWPLSL